MNQTRRVNRRPRMIAGSYDVQYTIPLTGLDVELDHAEAFEVLDGGSNPNGTRILMDTAQGGGSSEPDGLQSFPCVPGKVHLGPFKRLQITGGDSREVVLRIYATRSVAVSTADPTGKPRKLHLLRLEGEVYADGAQPLSLTAGGAIAETQREGLKQLWLGQLELGTVEQFDVQRFWSGHIAANAAFEVCVFVKPHRDSSDDPTLVQRFASVAYAAVAGFGSYGGEPVTMGSGMNVVDFSQEQCMQPGIATHSTGIGSLTNNTTGYNLVPIPEGAILVYINWATGSALEVSAEIAAVGA